MIKIEKLTTKDCDHLIEIIHAEFYRNEPESPEFKKLLNIVTTNCCHTGLGFLARDTKTNKVVGGALCEDLSLSVYSGESDPELSVIEMLIKELNEKYFKGATFEANTYLTIKFIAVDINFAGKGIATDLVKAALDRATQNGFKFAHVESAGSRSQSVFGARMGFDVVEEIRFEDFVLNGERPITPTKGYETIQLMIKPLLMSNRLKKNTKFVR